MKRHELDVVLPCCNEAVKAPGNMSGRPLTVDRKCPRCACWWRVTTRYMKTDAAGVEYHDLTLTRVGVLKEPKPRKERT